MDPASITLIFNLIRTTMKVGSQLKGLMKRVEEGEVITLEELHKADDEQLSLTNKLKDLQ